jgi:hypothetical protein
MRNRRYAAPMTFSSHGRAATAFALLLLALTACVGTTTQLAPLPKGAVEAEQEKQRELALQENEQQQARLDDIAYPILVMGASLCPNDLRTRLAARFATVGNYEKEMQPAAIRVLGLSDTLTVLTVTNGGPAARAGLSPGDHIVAVGVDALRAGTGTVKEFTELLAKHREAGNKQISVTLQRGKETRRIAIHLEEVCDYGSVVLQSSDLNAYADGENIYLTSTMMRFVDNDELRVVIAHEFAHNAMGHIKTRKKNSLFGAILGAIGDLAMAAQGVNTGGYYTSQGAKAGAMVFSQDFEREADYVGLYALTLADLPINAAPTFWRHMGQTDPKSIGFAHSHPTTAERFVRMEQGIAEIEQKVTSKQPLQPNRKGTPKLSQPPERIFAGVGRARDTAIAKPAASNTAMARDQVAQPVEVGTSLTQTQVAEPAVRGYVPEPSAMSSSAAEAIPSYPQSGSVSPSDAQQTRRAMKGRSADALTRDPRLKDALNDVLRLGVVTEYREARPGLLLLTVGDGFTKENAVEFQLGLLYVAYCEVTGGNEVARFELWRGDAKIGQYTKEGLTLTPTGM